MSDTVTNTVDTAQAWTPHGGASVGLKTSTTVVVVSGSDGGPLTGASGPPLGPANARTAGQRIGQRVGERIHQKRRRVA